MKHVFWGSLSFCLDQWLCSSHYETYQNSMLNVYVYMVYLWSIDTQGLFSPLQEELIPLFCLMIAIWTRSVFFSCDLIDIDMLSELSNQILMKISSFAFVVDIEYENLPPFYFSCKMIGHNSNNCKRYKVEDNNLLV